MKIITTEDELKGFVEDIRDSEWIGVDTEFLREKTYSPRLCLVQISTPDLEVCIDPLAINDLQPLESVLTDSRIMKILHSCRQDLEAFDTRFSGCMANLFDTQIAAAFCGYGDQVSYAMLVEKICDVALSKLYTRADWSLRPLPLPQLEYAIEDVRYLEQIRQYLEESLISLGRRNWHLIECEKSLSPDEYRIKPEDAWKRLKGAGGLDPRYHPCARALAVWREQKAQYSNRPREWILSTAALLEVSMRSPQKETQLGQIQGVNAGVVRKSGQQILEIVNNNLPDPNAAPIWSTPSIMTSEEKKKVKGVMKMLKTVSEGLKIAQSLLSNRQNVERFVRGDRELPLFQGWRLEVVGADILERYQD